MAEILQSLLTISLLIFITTIMNQFHFTISSKDSQKPTGFTLNLIPADSPQSPLYDGNLAKQERIQRMINITLARDHYSLHRTLSSSSSSSNTTPIIDPQNISFGLLRDLFYFGVTLFIGHPVPKFPYYLLMDTGGGLIWTQCLPCTHCFPVEHGSYDPSVSNNYFPMSCKDPACRKGVYDCVENKCSYKINYPDGAQSSGHAAYESFTFTSAQGEVVSIAKMIFGCSTDNQNFRFGKTNAISGVMGLSMSPESLISQLINIIDKQFSYCLIDMNKGLNHSLYLSFGSDVHIPPGSDVSSTPFVSPPLSNYYYLDLLDIVVGSHRMAFPIDTFQIDKDGNGGFIIDSGAPITLLSRNARGTDTYTAVLGVFQKFYDAHGLRREHDGPYKFDLCYSVDRGFSEYLSLNYRLSPRTDFLVEGIDVHYFDPNGFFCVAILPTEGSRSVLGAWHQQKKRIVYDLYNFALNYTSDSCLFR